MKKLLLLIVPVLLLTSCSANDPAFVSPVGDTPVIIKGKIDGTYHTVTVDSVEDSLVTIGEQHHEVHMGNMFTVSDTVLADTTTVKWQIHTADSLKYAHLVFNLFCTGEATYLVTEGADRNDGTALTEVNKRRVGTVDIAETIVTRTPTGGTTDGAITLFSVRTGSTGVAGKTIEGGLAWAAHEFILKPNTKYVISITTYTNGVYATAQLDWYEVAD